MMAASNKCTTSGKSILFANLFSSKCRAELRQVEVVLSMERNRLSLHFEREQGSQRNRPNRYCIDRDKTLFFDVMNIIQQQTM